MGVNAIGELKDQNQSGKNFGIWTLIKQEPVEPKTWNRFLFGKPKHKEVRTYRPVTESEVSTLSS